MISIPTIVLTLSILGAPPYVADTGRPASRRVSI
jgi:hypothetical protein